jgi:hypothetical protein
VGAVDVSQGALAEKREVVELDAGDEPDGIVVKTVVSFLNYRSTAPGGSAGSISTLMTNLDRRFWLCSRDGKRMRGKLQLGDNTSGDILLETGKPWTESRAVVTDMATGL